MKYRMVLYSIIRTELVLPKDHMLFRNDPLTPVFSAVHLCGINKVARIYFCTFGSHILVVKKLTTLTGKAGCDTLMLILMLIIFIGYNVSTVICRKIETYSLLYANM